MTTPNTRTAARTAVKERLDTHVLDGITIAPPDRYAHLAVDRYPIDECVQARVVTAGL